MKIKIHHSQLEDLLRNRFEIPDDEIEGFIACWGHYLGKTDNKEFVFHPDHKLEGCEVYSEFMKGQMQELVREIKVNQWYIGEKEHHAVEFKHATMDFIENHLDKFARGYRECYCNHVCKYREDCNIGVKGEEIMGEN